MEAMFLPRRDWILSGSFAGWGDPIIPRLTHVIFLTMPAGPRLARLRKRERLRADADLQDSADWQAGHKAFLEWAAGYDDPTFSGRNRLRHEAWLEELPCSVLRIDATQSAKQVLAEAIGWLDPDR
jgi:adenylate kinase family enzyme